MVLAAGALLSVAAPSAGSTFTVSSNGTDSGTCGSNPPCASIAQAVANASPGDSIAVGPGRYAGATVTKALTLSSSANGGANINGTIVLASDGIVFGKKGKGFAVTPGSSNDAIVVNANAVTVRGNFVSRCDAGVEANGSDVLVRDNTFNNCNVGVVINGSGALVRDNLASYLSLRGMALATTSSNAQLLGNKFMGGFIAVDVGGTGHLLRRNVMTGSVSALVSNSGPTDVTVQENLIVGALSLGFSVSDGSGWTFIGNAAIGGGAPAFYVTTSAPSTFIGNVANGGSSDGFVILNAPDVVMQGNTAIDNGGNGVILGSVGTGATISGGNVYGNATCGVSNSSSNAVSIDKVYWGAPSGPGLDPADDICANVAMTTVTNPAAKAAKIKLPSVK
jgi:hypothetical protein